jgi:hypothetical protein
MSSSVFDFIRKEFLTIYETDTEAESPTNSQTKAEHPAYTLIKAEHPDDS